MGKRFTEITPDHKEFILAQHLFFVGTARDEGRVNISPKGMDSLRILGPNKVVWLNLTGSGNETATHLIKNDRMTLMFCSFEKKPLILRLYGTAKIYHSRDEPFQKYIDLFPPMPGARQIIEMVVDLTQNSCGYAVPFMEFKEDRSLLNTWTDKKSEEELKKYHQDRNSISIDGFETGI